ncbi:LysR family transcriptional regulator [Pigmentiphaga litoralis]|uniref:DNA-binding transcriptional LysR family regulator n=1 Tax=Pigmentiphaga litoralis TaxID=516702 RepID=A0A7Y9IR66_9BURK|nr:LysR family transcriptional regulator [Pigmentiphaga litoralis]NYE24945.1 DNA-binding transcriptional LysR family regulator [Pigmentiphaga litoralis]NYE81441.1 DNA-binding transcriptional LysR family regulator [Pigmentiphaga litoralis]
MTPPVEHIDDLMILLEVVEAGGFSAASRNPGRSKSVMSRRVQALEERLGVSLLVRNSRRFDVTAVGQRLVEHARAIRAEAQAAFAFAAHSLESPGGTLQVSCPIALAVAEVGPLAIELAALHPRLHISLSTYSGRPEAQQASADIVILPAIGPLKDAGFVARKLVDFPYILVAAPAIAEAYRHATSPHDLDGAPAIGWTFHDAPEQWSFENATGETAHTRVDIRFKADSLALVADAALRSLGIAQLPAGACISHLATGALCRVLEAWTPPAIGMYAIYPSRRHLTPGGRLFIDALHQRLQSYGRPGRVVSIDIPTGT